MQRTDVRPVHLGSRESLLRMLALIITGLVVAGLGAEVIRFAIPDHEESRGWRTVVRLLDLNDENSIATWFQGLHLAFVGFLALVWGRGEPRRTRWGWLVLGAIFFAMSLDELVSIHEQFTTPLRQLLDIDSGPFYYAWVILGLLLALTVALTMTPFLLRLPRATALGLIAAGAVFVAGAVGMEMVGASIAATPGGMTHLTYRLAMMTEETLEMIGILLAVRALLVHFTHSRATAPQELADSQAR